MRYVYFALPVSASTLRPDGEARNLATMHETLLFDVDHTLYPFSLGVEKWFSRVVDRIIIEELDITADEAARLREEYYHQFGSTLTGLIYYHDINVPRFFKKKGVAPLDAIHRDEKAMKMIKNSDRRVIALTNASKRHGERVLEHLAVRDKFEKIMGIDCLGYWGKPFRKGFDKAFQMSAIDPKTTIFFEDSPRNLLYPKSLGMMTVLIGDHFIKIGNAPDHVDIHCVTLPEAMEAVNAL